jgi:hypothetical protein
MRVAKGDGGLTFPLTIAYEDIDRIEAYVSRHCTLIGEGSSEDLWYDRIFDLYSILIRPRDMDEGRRDRNYSYALGERELHL